VAEISTSSKQVGIRRKRVFQSVGEPVLYWGKKYNWCFNGKKKKIEVKYN
jgi:hypothetical protein